MGLRHAAGLLAAAALVLGAPAAAAPGNGRIAYVTGGSVYSVNPAGTGAALVHSGAFPAFSPDGARIVFSDATPINGALPIMVADADGSNAHQIGSSSNPHAFVWSPDGTRIAFVTGDGQGGFSIVDLKADGSGSTTVSQDASGNSPPSWSPNGTQLAFATTNNADIAVVNADGSGRHLLIQDATPDTAPAWSPDGTQIAFFRSAFGTVLYVIRPDGSGLRQLGRVPVDDDYPPVWSPDGKRLAYAGQVQSGYSRFGPYYRYDVYTIGADGIGERRLTDGAVSSFAGANPVWSPDGTRIAFTSTRLSSITGPQLFVMNSDGTCQTQISSAPMYVSSLTWQASPSTPAADPLQCAALSLHGALTASTDHPALDDDRVYVYRGTITNNGNVTSDALQLHTTAASLFSYVSATVSGGQCSLTADVNCTLPALPPGASADVEIRLLSYVSGLYPLQATVAGTGSTPDGDLSDNTDSQYRRFPFCEISSQIGSTIRAPGGDDLICGTVGRDRIFAGAGDDHVLAGPGHDVVHAGAGDDEVDGGFNTDYLYGEGGDDKLHGGESDDVLIGGSGKDSLWGDNGGDYLKGGPGADRFFGGGGNDVIDSRDGLTEHVYCGFGDHDVVRADLRDIVNSDCEKVVRAPAQARAPR